VSGYTKEHWMDVKRLLRYVKGGVDSGVVYDKCAPGILQGFSDADRAGHYETPRPTTGFMFMLRVAAVNWAFNVQRTVALSTIEAEYIALC